MSADPAELLFDRVGEEDDEQPAEALRDPLGLYVRGLDRWQLLTPAEERELARRKDEGDEHARQLLIESNLRLVMSVSRSYSREGVPLLDLIQEGNLGLMRAVEKFDYRRGFRLSTYAMWWIREGMSRFVAEQGQMVRLPPHVAGELRKARRARRGLAQELHREPTPGEVADEVGTTAERVQRLFEVVQAYVSLETPVGDGESNVIDLIEDTTQVPEQEAGNHLCTGELREALARLSPRQRFVLRERYGLDGTSPKTLEQLGEIMGVTRERVRQIEQRALRRLQAIAPGLELYLEA